MKKTKNFKLLWHYLKDDKFKLLIYLLLVLLSYLPALLAAYFWGKALEFLILKDFINFIIFLGLWDAVYIF